MKALDKAKLADHDGQNSSVISARRSGHFVCNSKSHVAQTDPDDPYGIAQIRHSDDNNVLLIPVPDGAAYLDLQHVWNSDDAATGTALQVRAFGFKQNGNRRGATQPEDHGNAFDAADSFSQLLPVKQSAGMNARIQEAQGWWFPLYTPDGVHTVDFSGAAEIVKNRITSEGGEDSSSSSSSSETLIDGVLSINSDNNFVSVVGADYIIVAVNRRAGTGTSIIGMVMGAFVW